MHRPGRSQVPHISTFQRHLQHGRLDVVFWLTQRGESADV